MLRPVVLVRILLILTPIFFVLHVTRGTYRFQQYLHSRQITANDFPERYIKVLNDSVSHNEQPPLDFDYADTFPNNKIPRIIHFIWFQNLYNADNRASQIPVQGSHAPELCRKFNPSYEIRMWDATMARNFIAEHYEWFLPVYDGYRYPIQRIDALKYFVLFHYGGVYMDLDIACRRPLDPLLSFPAWFPEASPLGVNNDLMAARRGHPILERMTRRLQAKDKNWIFPYLTIFWSTGPSFGSDILREWVDGGYADKATSIGTESDEFFVLPQIYYSESHTFFGHSPGGTWHGGDVAFILWFVDHPWALLIIFAVVAVVAIRLFKARQRRVLSAKEDARMEMV